MCRGELKFFLYERLEKNYVLIGIFNLKKSEHIRNKKFVLKQNMRKLEKDKFESKPSVE